MNDAGTQPEAKMKEKPRSIHVVTRCKTNSRPHQYAVRFGGSERAYKVFEKYEQAIVAAVRLQARRGGVIYIHGVTGFVVCRVEPEGGV